MRKHLLVVLAFVLAGLIAWAQPLNIGGHRAVQDNRNGIWLCSVPQSLFGSDYNATVNYGDSISDFKIDGVEVANGGAYIFAAIAGGKNYPVTFVLNDEVVAGDITFTWLPVVELKGTFGHTYSYGTVTVNEPDSAYAEPLMAKLKWRGTVTNDGAKHKRNYRIKFVNEDSTKQNHRFFGLRNDNSWILDAGQMDFMRVRNRVGTDIWLEMARRPWYSDTLPNARNGSRGQMVEVILNDYYAGIYNMCEPIDRKQLKLKRYDEENGEFHGALWQAYTWSRTVTMSRPKGHGLESSAFWDGFEMKYPDFDEVGVANWWPLDNAVYSVPNQDLEEEQRKELFEYYFDIPVMQDYYILISALQALDNESLNIFYACYDQQDNPRLTMTPWDLDISVGGNYDPKVDLPNMVKPERNPRGWISNISLLLMEDMYHNEINERYRELREGPLSTDNMINHYRTAVNELENSGAAAREEQRWSGDSDLAGKSLDLSAELEYVEDWIRRHMDYLDEHVFIENPDPDPEPFIKGDVNGDGEVNIADVNVLVGIILGREAAEDVLQRADVNEDTEINISDVNAVIRIILS